MGYARPALPFFRSGAKLKAEQILVQKTKTQSFCKIDNHKPGRSTIPLNGWPKPVKLFLPE